LRRRQRPRFASVLEHVPDVITLGFDKRPHALDEARAFADSIGGHTEAAEG
jgi:hypothetical protein